MRRRLLVALVALVGLSALIVPGAAPAGAYSRQFYQYATPPCNSYVTFEAGSHYAAIDPVSGCYLVGVRLYYKRNNVNTSTGWVFRYNGATAATSFGVGTATKAVFAIQSNWHKQTTGGGIIYLTCYPASSSSGACQYGWL